MPKFAANLSMMFGETSFLDRFAAARAAGFDAVEFLFPYAFEGEQICKRLERYQQQLVLFNLPAGDWTAGERGIACDPRRIGEFQDSVELALDYADELSVKQLHCLAGKLPPNVPPERAHEIYVGNLQFAAEACRAQGLRLLIEPINTFDIPGYFLTGTRQALDIIDECGADNLFLQYDIYHMQRMEGELANTLRANLARIAHIQLADNPGRHEPGTGEINYPFLFQLLDEIGYHGWIGCEYTPSGETAACLAWRDPWLAAPQTQQQRNKMIQGLRTVVYPVDDIADATAWYRRVLERDPYFEEPYYVGFEVGGCELGLIPDGTSGAAGATAYWGTADIVAEVNRIVALGATLDSPATEVGGGISVATLKDPYGNLFGVIENPHFDLAKVR